MILDLYYSNFNHTNLESCLDKLYNKYLTESHNEKVQKKNDEETKSNGSEKVARKPENGKSQPTTSMMKKTPVRNERRSESHSRSVPTKSPIKTSPPQRKSEPPSHSYRSQPPPPSITRTPQKNSASPHHQKKISPKDLRNRVRTSPQDKNYQPVSPVKSMTPRALEKELDKLNIDVANQSKQIQPAVVDENILRQQNSSENSSPINTLKPKPTQTIATATATPNKVYFREENSENLSWNGETSFEDESEATIESPRVNQYSSSFLNFLSNN